MRQAVIWLRRGALLAGFGALFGLVYLGLTWDLRAAKLGDRPGYRSVPVGLGDLDQTVVATGVMEPFVRVIVQSEVPGIVDVLRVDDGDRVTLGQPLVELDRSRLEDLAAELRSAYRLQSARVRVDVIGRAQAELEKRRKDFLRIERLRQKGVASEEQLDEVAHALRLAKIGLSDARAEQDARRASAEKAASALHRVERDLEKSIIRSPIDGIVVRRHVEVGAAVADLQNGGTVIAELADDHLIHLLGEVDENDIALVEENQRAQVQIDAFPGESFTGRVRKIASSGVVERGVSSFQVEVEVEPDARIRVGMSADAWIVVRTHRGVLLVPNAAILRGDDGPRVRRVNVAGEGEGEPQPIHELYSDGFQTAVDRGLSEGDLILVRAEQVR